MMTKINIDASKIDTEERYYKIRSTAEEIHTVLNSKIFMDQVMRIKKHGERSKYKDYTNTEIYKILMEGAEQLSPEVDYEWDIWIDDTFSRKNFVGMTSPSMREIIVNTKFFDNMPTVEVGSLITHEQGHKLGFHHDFFNTKERPFSICYQLNNAYEYAWSKIYNIYPVIKLVTKRSWKYLWLKKVSYEVKSWPEY